MTKAAFPRHTGGGDDRKDWHATRKYVSQRHTVFGNFYRTQLLDEAGADAIFNPLSGGGDMPMPAADGLFAVRVMDYDWGKRDDLIGETTVRLQDLLAAGAPLSLPLYKKGKGDRGEVHACAAFVSLDVCGCACVSARRNFYLRSRSRPSPGRAG